MLHTCLIPSSPVTAAVQWLEMNANVVAVDQVYIYIFFCFISCVTGYISSMMNIIHTV